MLLLQLQLGRTPRAPATPALTFPPRRSSPPPCSRQADAEAAAIADLVEAAAQAAAQGPLLLFVRDADKLLLPSAERQAELAKQLPRLQVRPRPRARLGLAVLWRQAAMVLALGTAWGSSRRCSCSWQGPLACWHGCMGCC
jgi:hypothetical protein